MARKFTKYPSNYVKASTNSSLAICNWVNWEAERGRLDPTNIKLEIGIDKVSSDGMTRYMTVKIAGQTVTRMVADAIHCKMSKARDTYDCMIVKGCGMDMGFLVQNDLYRAAYQAGYPDMFDKDYYTYLGKKSHNRYPYEK